MLASDQDEAALRERLLDEPTSEHNTRRRASSQSPRRMHMSVVERMMLSPYEKWVTHGRFPFKIVLHVLLLALTLAQMLIYESQNASYMRASHRNWAYFFLPPSSDVGITPRFQRDLHTVNQSFEAVFFMRDAYFSIANESVANYEYHSDPVDPSAVRAADMVVTRRRNDHTLDLRRYRVARFPSDIVGPFHANMTARQRKKLLQSLESVAFTFHLRDHQYGNFYDECFDWGIHVSLRVVQGAQLKAQVDTCEIASCSTLSFWSALQQRFVWLHVVIAAVTAIYMVLSGRALMRSVRLVSSASTLVSETATTHPSMPLSLRFQLLNRLQIVVFVALSLLFFSSSWSLLFLKAHVPISYWHRVVQASAILLLWSSLVGYLEHNRQIYSIVLTLRWGAPRVLQFLIGVSPIFVGFALFGTIYFGPRVKAFGSLSESMMTLFAVLNGDVILDTFDALELHHFGVAGKLYVYSFISLFIYVVLNIFIAIVEEAFFATRHCRRLLDVLLTDPKYAATNVAQDAEVSSEMVRLLLKLIDEGEDAKSKPRERDEEAST